MIRRRRKRHANHERWLVSYADFITLLFAFFVVMYATAQVDRKKMGQLSVAIQTAFQEMGGLSPEKQATVDIKETIPPEIALEIEKAKQAELTRPSPVDARLLALQGELKQSMSAEISRHELALNESADGLVISLRETGFFDSGSAAIRTNSRSAFGRIAKLLTQQEYRIRIEGHTDNVPIHNSQFVSNWELSTARATELVRLLVTNYDFTPEHLSAAGYAQYHPAAPNSSTDGRAQNRRVDIVVLRGPAGQPPGKPSPQRP